MVKRNPGKIAPHGEAMSSLVSWQNNFCLSTNCLKNRKSRIYVEEASVGKSLDLNSYLGKGVFGCSGVGNK